MERTSDRALPSRVSTVDAPGPAPIAPGDGPPSGGSPYDLHNHTVLKHLLQGILNALAKKGDQNVEGACKAFTSTQAECEVRGTNTQGQHFANLFTLTVNLSNGNFTVTNVKAVH